MRVNLGNCRSDRSKAKGDLGRRKRPLRSQGWAADNQEQKNARGKVNAAMDAAHRVAPWQQQRLRGVDVADGDGQRVGGVGDSGAAVEREQARHHELDLLLGGQAVAHDAGFDVERRVLGDRRLQVAAASMATPRTWPSFSADLALAEKKTSSMATQSGPYWVIRAISRRRPARDASGVFSFLLRRIVPDATWMEGGVARGVVHLDHAVAGELRTP